MKSKKEKEFHKPVMPEKVFEGLNCRTGKLYVDATVGGAGHSIMIARAIQPDGKLLCLDIDEDAIKEAENQLKTFDNTIIVRENYTKLSDVISNYNLGTVDGGILLDLGASFHQLTSPSRGFSFQYDAELDMRMNKDFNISAKDLVNTLSFEELVKIFKEYGEERYAARIARSIEETRKKELINTTTQLANMVKRVIPRSKNSRIHPATRVFQALRIAVNNELDNIKTALKSFIDITQPGARIVIISFHSLEDRIVKNFYKYWSSECVCLPIMPVCNCNHIKRLEIINKKPIIPDEAEIINNPAARSAKLRIAERI